MAYSNSIRIFVASKGNNKSINKEIKMEIMEKLNRYYLVYVAFVAILVYCVAFSHNVYLNAFLILSGFLGCIMAFAYIGERKNEKETVFMEKLSDFSNEKNI